MPAFVHLKVKFNKVSIQYWYGLGVYKIDCQCGHLRSPRSPRPPQHKTFFIKLCVCQLQNSTQVCLHLNSCTHFKMYLRKGCCGLPVLPLDIFWLEGILLASSPFLPIWVLLLLYEWIRINLNLWINLARVWFCKQLLTASIVVLLTY